MSAILDRTPPVPVEAEGEQKVEFPFPGIPTTSDGAGTVVWVETNITQGACAYPITSSTTMGGGYQAAAADGKKNLWGEDLAFIEPESEHSAATSCEGFAVAGGRVTNFTSGQGLVLMKEVLFTISGKRLPIVFHIGARALTSHSLNVHTGHDDVVSVNDCGWGILYARNAQESGDMALICRRAAEDSDTPFMNVQDGFLTTHTIENVRLLEPEMMKIFVGDPNRRLRNLMDPKIPLMSGVVQNQDSYMKGKIAQRAYYDKVPQAIRAAMDEFYELTGRRYNPVIPYRLEDAEYAIVGSGCMMETAEAAVDWIRENMGVKVGLLHITVYRPWPSYDIVNALKHVKAVTVLERLDIPIMVLVSHAHTHLIDRVAERHPGLRLVMDHLALTRLTYDEDAFRDLDRLLALARRPNVAVKASALPCYTRDAYPYRKLHPYIRRVYDAFGPQRMFWGTDLSRLPCTYHQGVTMFTEEIPWLSAEDKNWIMGRGVCEWLGWTLPAGVAEARVNQGRAR